MFVLISRASLLFVFFLGDPQQWVVLSTTVPLLSALIKGTAWGKGTNGKSSCPGWLCLLWCVPPACPFNTAPSSCVWHHFFHYYAWIASAVSWSHIKEKLGPYGWILPFVGRSMKTEGGGNILCSLPAASCAISLNWMGINRTGPRWAAYDWRVSGCVCSFVSQVASCQLNN